VLDENVPIPTAFFKATQIKRDEFDFQRFFKIIIVLFRLDSHESFVKVMIWMEYVSH